MAINFSNSLIGLSILTGGTSNASSFAAASDSAAVLAAKKAFKLPVVTPPWQLAPSTASESSQIAAIKRMRTIIDTAKGNSLGDLPDVQTSFTTYKALDSLRILAEAASKKTTSSAERATLEKLFAKGLSDLQTFMGKADTDLLTLNFGVATRRSDSIGVTAPNYAGTHKGEAIATSRSEVLSGLSGTEVFKITLSRGSVSQTVNVDLAGADQPLTLDSVANAINVAIAANVVRDANGDPILDSEGNPSSQWKSTFKVEKEGDNWGLVLHAAGNEKLSIDQVDSQDALMIASGRTVTDGPTSAQIFRIDSPDIGLNVERLSTINAIDTAATEKAKAAAEAAAAAAKAKASKSYTSTTTETEAPDPTVYAATTARAIATDADGYSYVVGTTAGDMGSALSDGKNDLYLTKVDSEGKPVWMRSLGAAGTGEGVAVTVSANGRITVAGTVSGSFSGGDDRETDMLVAQFTADGTQQFATALRQIGNESATAIAVGNDGSIYLAGRASTGGGDAVVARLDAQGRAQERRTINSGGSDTITALQLDGAGGLLALTKQGPNASLMRIDATSLNSDLGVIELGEVDARALAISNDGEIAVVGSAALAVSGDQANGITGGRDAFVTRISADFSATVTSYIGTGSDDQADSAAYMNGALYVGGRTNGDLEGTLSGKIDAFVARIDRATGMIADVEQWGLVAHNSEPVKIAAVSGGATALGALGLARGALNPSISTALSSQTTLKEGDSFSLSVDDGRERKIVIAKNETLATLAQKVQRLLGTNGTATTSRVDGKLVLRIEAKAGHSIELMAGADGADALAKLGMEPVRLIAAAPKPKNAPKVTPGGTYSLNLDASLSVSDAKVAAATLGKITAAISMTQSAYRSLYWDDGKAAQVNGTLANAGGGSLYQQGRLAQYQAALNRLTG